MNDLWQYQEDTNQWIWISGNYTIDATAIYGTEGVTPPLTPQPVITVYLPSYSSPSYSTPSRTSLSISLLKKKLFNYEFITFIISLILLFI